jgi:hypothetical protein
MHTLYPQEEAPPNCHVLTEEKVMKPNTRIAAGAMFLFVMALCACQAKKQEAPKVVGTQSQATAVLNLIGTTRGANQPFLDTHAAMRDNLNSLESTANILSGAPGNQQLMRTFSNSLDQAINRANIIATRASESPDNKKKAAELRDKLIAIRKS